MHYGELRRQVYPNKLSSGYHRFWAAIYFLDNTNFRDFAVSHEKKAVCDLLQHAKEVTYEEKMKSDEGAMEEC